MPTQPDIHQVTADPRPDPSAHRASLRVPATLLLAGQLAYILVTQAHPGGDANDHHSAFTEYAASELWTAVHVGQFASMAVLLAGVLTFFSALDRQRGGTSSAGRLGAAAAVVALSLHAALQAVDGVALKQAVTAWAGAPAADEPSRLAAAEAVRWLEWGVRSYQDLAMGAALLLLAAAVTRAAHVPTPIAGLVALSGVAYLWQGWLVGTEGFSPAGSVAIVAGFVLGVVWMSWLVAVAWRAPSAARRLAR